MTAHQGGWDEILLVLTPIALFAGLPPKALYDQAVSKAGDMGENEWVVLTYLLSPEYATRIQG